MAVNIPDYTDDNSNLDILEDLCLMTGAKLCNKDEIAEFEGDSSLVNEEIFGKLS